MEPITQPPTPTLSRHASHISPGRQHIDSTRSKINPHEAPATTPTRGNSSSLVFAGVGVADVKSGETVVVVGAWVISGVPVSRVLFCIEIMTVASTAVAAIVPTGATIRVVYSICVLCTGVSAVTDDADTLGMTDPAALIEVASVDAKEAVSEVSLATLLALLAVLTS